MAPSGRWLIVVQPGEVNLSRHLQAGLGNLPFLDVIFDRRKGQRRRGRAPVRSEQRHRERRQPGTAREREQWVVFGYRLVRQPEHAEENLSCGSNG